MPKLRSFIYLFKIIFDEYKLLEDIESIQNCQQQPKQQGWNTKTFTSHPFEAVHSKKPTRELASPHKYSLFQPHKL